MLAEGSEEKLEFVNLVGFGIHYSQVAGLQAVNVENVQVYLSL